MAPRSGAGQKRGCSALPLLLAGAGVAGWLLGGSDVPGEAFTSAGASATRPAAAAEDIVGLGDEAAVLRGRRAWTQALLAAAAGPAAAGGLGQLPAAAEVGTVFVAGATGNTGKRVVKELLSQGYNVVAGARSLDKAKTAFASSAKVESVAFDVEKMSADAMADSLKGAKLVICAMGFVPGNPFEMNKLAKAVDNEGTIKLVDAAKKAGVQRFILVSSILTNGRAIGQESNPGFVITNAFGGALDEKLIAEKYLVKSGLDYTILRPGGLKDAAPEGTAVIGAEDTLLAGEVSRDLVAKVAVEALRKSGASRKTVELIEDGSCLSNIQKCEALPAGQGWTRSLRH
mmetsp:Transcript_6307/g.23679  ORF Transcript_6307/g.23679 Transcript_6307/m.23679 type:complete len:344 (+) Transcript_6307:82-1113(+)